MKQKFDIYTIKESQTDLICQNLEVWNFQHISQSWAQQANHITYFFLEETMPPLSFMALLFPYTNVLKMFLIQAMLKRFIFYQWLFSLWHLHQWVANKKKNEKSVLKKYKISWHNMPLKERTLRDFMQLLNSCCIFFPT